MGPDFACCRLIFGEADQLPGLTVDRFSDILVTQILSLGMEQRKPLLFRLLVEELEKRGARPRAIYERNDVAIRELEGMEPGQGLCCNGRLGNGAIRPCGDLRKRRLL